jgi:hypothetical protein
MTADLSAKAGAIKPVKAVHPIPIKHNLRHSLSHNLKGKKANELKLH